MSSLFVLAVLISCRTQEAFPGDRRRECASRSSPGSQCRVMAAPGQMRCSRSSFVPVEGAVFSADPQRMRDRHRFTMDRHAYIALDQFLALLKKFSTRTYHAYPTTMCSSSDAYGFSYPDECPLREAQQSPWAHQHTVTVPRSAARNDLRDTPSGVLREPAVRRIHEALHQVGESGPVKVRFEFQNFRPNGKLDCRTSFSIRLCFYATWNRPVARISPTLP